MKDRTVCTKQIPLDQAPVLELGGGLTVLVLPMPGTLASPEPSMPSFLTDMQERSMTKAERQKLRRRQLTDLFEQLDSLVPGQGDERPFLPPLRTLPSSPLQHPGECTPRVRT